LKAKLLVLMLLASPIFGSPLHPFHSSVGDCVFNAKDNIWELSIRLFQDDLAVGLSQFSGAPFSFQKNNQVDAVLEKYVRTYFGIQVNQKRTTPYRFLGWEAVDDVIWVYLEIPSAQDLSGVYIENRLLADSFPDQSNLLQVVRNSDKRSYLFQKNEWIQQVH
jgi:hypothetical protein